MPTRLEYLMAKHKAGIELTPEEAEEAIALCPPLPQAIEDLIEAEVERYVSRLGKPMTIAELIAGLQSLLDDKLVAPDTQVYLRSNTERDLDYISTVDHYEWTDPGPTNPPLVFLIGEE